MNSSVQGIVFTQTATKKLQSSLVKALENKQMSQPDNHSLPNSTKDALGNNITQHCYLQRYLSGSIPMQLELSWSWSAWPESKETFLLWASDLKHCHHFTFGIFSFCRIIMMHLLFIFWITANWILS